MNLARTLTYLSLILFCILLPSRALCTNLAKATINVTDEEGKIVESAEIQLSFKYEGLRKDLLRGKTDLAGKYTASALSDGNLSGSVSKDGYYDSAFHTMFFSKKLGRWQPWNKDINVALRPKIKPVPMYVRRQWIEIPLINESVGFDLMKSDWVTPYGQGVHSDFVMRLEKKYKNVDNFETTLAITFSNKNDGIQIIKDDRGGIYSEGSIFRLPRYAMENGYQQTLEKKIIRGQKEWRDDIAKDNNFVFRVRSEIDSEGNFKKAMYGKIRGDIEYDPVNSKTALIHMFYYLNPDYTRNLEFDTNKNLFGPLPKGEYPIGLP